MAFRFRKRIKIAPGIHVNVSKTGVSTSLGRPGLTVNLRGRNARTTVGIPGSGLSHSTDHSTPNVPAWLVIAAAAIFLVWLFA